ncbi:MAG: formate dehydrogenase [Stellaceae bacterium]
MSDQRIEAKARRRDFLKLMGAGVAGAAALAGGEAAAEAAKPVCETGYRETAHVRKFYETARF